MLKLTIAQLNLTVGDIAGNAARMTAAARQAWEQEADIVIFSELSLTAYYPADLLEEDGFMQRVEVAMDELLRVSCQFPSLHWVIGLPVEHNGPGKKLRNMLRVIRDGEVLLDYAKQLLPTYNIFDERRHFEPGPDSARLLDVAGVRIGFLICEDGWNDTALTMPATLSNTCERLRRHWSSRSMQARQTLASASSAMTSSAPPASAPACQSSTSTRSADTTNWFMTAPLSLSSPTPVWFSRRSVLLKTSPRWVLQADTSS